MALNIRTLFLSLVDLLRRPYSQVDLDLLGKYTSYEGIVSYEPYLKSMLSKSVSKLSVGKLISDKNKLARNRSEVVLDPLSTSQAEEAPSVIKPSKLSKYSSGSKFAQKMMN
jgi:hypothetical protein